MIAKEKQKIKVTMQDKRFGKHMTIIQGIDASQIDMKDLIKKLKTKLACGGTYKNNQIELQGDHRQRVKKLLVVEGFPEEIIEVR
jgi:translation initiation factor 1